MCGEVVCDGGGLVRGRGVVVGEAPRGACPGGLGGGAGSAADGGDVRAVGREGRLEERGVAVLAANAAVAGGEEDGDAARTELGVCLAQFAAG